MKIVQFVFSVLTNIMDMEMKMGYISNEKSIVYRVRF